MTSDVDDRGPYGSPDDGPPASTAAPTEEPRSPAPAPRALGRRNHWFSDLHRSSGDRMVAGVAGGLAETTGVPPLIIRLIFVVSATFLVGLVVYGIAWAVLPTEPDDGSTTSIPGRLLVLSGSVLALILLPFGGALATLVSRSALPLILILVGMALINRDPDRRSHGEVLDGRNPVMDDPTVPTPGSPGDQPPGSGADRPPNSGADRPEPAPPSGSGTGWAPSLQVRRRPSLRFPFVGLLTWSIVLVATGLMAALAVMGGPVIRPGAGLAMALVIFSTGLIVSAFRGRARGLILPILVLGAILGLLAVVDVRVDTLRGSFAERASTAADLTDPLHSTFGTSTLSLTDLVLEQDRTAQVRVDFGILRVRLPLDTTVVVKGRVGLGTIETYRYSRAGAVYEPGVEKRWIDDGVPAAGSPVERDLIEGTPGAGSTVRSYQWTGPGVGDTGFGREIDRVFDRGSTHVLTLELDVGSGGLELVEPYWADDGWDPVEARQLCTVAGAAKGTVEPCSDVDEKLRLPLCINDNGYLVDCTEDRPGTLESPRIAACRDLHGDQVDCTYLGIEAPGAQLIGPPDDPNTDTAPDQNSEPPTGPAEDSTTEWAPEPAAPTAPITEGEN